MVSQNTKEINLKYSIFLKLIKNSYKVDKISYPLQLLITVLTFLINCPIPFDPLSWASIGTNKAYLLLCEGNSIFFNLKRKKWTQKKIAQDHPILA